MVDSKTPKDEIFEYVEDFINAVREPLIVLNQDLEVLSASRSFYDLFKVKSEETLGRFIYDLGNKQFDIPELRELLETLLPRKTIIEDYEIEHEFAGIGGRAMLLSAREIQRAPGKEGLIFLAIEDITSRKQTENLLSESEERYRRLFETANDGILLLEKSEGKITHANPAIKKMLGYGPDELIGKGLVHIGFPRDIGTIQEIFHILEKDGILHYEDAPVQAKSGQVIDTDVYMVDKARLVQCNIRDITERKRMARRIEKERNYLSAVIDNIGEAIVICDAEGRIVRFNETARCLHGLPEQPIPPDQWARYYDLYQKDGYTPLPKEDIPLFRALQGERVLNAEIVVAPKHSRPSSLVCSGQALTDETGEIYGAVVGMHDITERKHMEEILRRERDLTQRYLGATQTIMVALDTEGRITMINRSGCELLGYAEDEILGCNWFETCLPQPEGINSVFPVFRRIMSGDLSSVEYFENSVVCRDGTQRLMGWHNAFLEDDDGRVVGALSSGEDITERKQAEHQLRASEEKYRVLVENANEAIFVTQDEKMKFVNPETEKLTGFSKKELTGKPFADLLHPEDRDLVLDRHRERLSGGEELPNIYSFRMINKAGEELLVELSTVLFNWEDRPATLNFIRDITWQKKLEAQLRQSQKMEAIGALAGGIAHDFNNILSSVIGYTELSLEEAEENPLLHQNLSQVLTAGNRARDLVKQILAFSRKEEQEFTPTPVAPLVKEALKMLRSTFPASIEVRENVKIEQGIVYGEPTQLHQVIVNLATNAKQAMGDEGGILEVSVETVSFDENIGKKFPHMPPGNYVRIAVSDTGCGISEQFQDRIFDPYFTTKEKGLGTGLGLSVVHGIVNDHKGHITVYSKPQKGTTFHVYLPLVGADRKLGPGQKTEPLPTGTESLLLVDDELPIIEMEQQILERLGYKVTLRTSAEEALEAFRANPDKFDLIITDMTMPNMAGDKLALEVKEIRPDVPVLLCTGFSERIDAQKTKDLGIEGFMMKPVSKADLAKMVREVLDK